jgi:ketosteroid isomerase-like protein
MDDIEVVQQIYAAMAAKDIERLAELIDPEVVITQDERLPWGGRFEGHPGFLDFAGKLTGSIASAVTIEAIFSADGDVVQAGRTRGTVVATGVEFDIGEVHRWTIRDGRAIRAHMSIDTPAMLEVLGRPAPA